MEITDISGTVSLVNNIQMPYLGLGVYKADDGREVISAIHHAFDAGYRLVDTAAFYKNEEGVGKAIKTSNLPREEIFVTTKLWVDDQGKENTRNAFEKSLQKMDLDYLDLYLIHWPVPDKYLESWKILQELYDEGRVKAIGVCNCMPHHLEAIKDIGGIQPMVLQNEFHPRLVQQEILDYCKENNIQYQAWSPLMRGTILQNEIIKTIAEKYKKSIAQVVIRWDLQKGVTTIPKSTHRERIFENANVFDFNLNDDELKLIDGLNAGERTGAHPDHFMEHFNK
ncbi:aldo/keto reductase [Gramella sp. AN32]|uniref:Aldo/keto reductase n=1 Tax=Christiangramia antarctica TaxID=2058158 RepID=A0ABW5XDB6_9FLAO|nr:aldo/keto reductase [Gramella sp. AN32]MCM4157559.1 aldo/keto reductase [Gramella sp. AN32]